MQTDPGQTTPVNTEQPEVAQRLIEAVRDWRTEMLESVTQNDGGQLSKDRKSVDSRPFPVGYLEFPRTWLPARDGEPQGGIQRSARAPNCSYFVNWTSTDDAMVWDVDVRTSGTYAVELLYTCPTADVGSTIELSFGDSRATGKVGPSWDPPLYTNQDTLPRPAAESTMKEFRPLDLGTIQLHQGRGRLTLRAREIPGRYVMDVRGVTLTLRGR